MVPRIKRSRQDMTGQGGASSLTTAFDAALALVSDANAPKFLMSGMIDKFTETDDALLSSGWCVAEDPQTGIDLLASGSVMSLFDAFVKVPTTVSGSENQVKGAHQDAALRIAQSVSHVDDDVKKTRLYCPQDDENAAILLTLREGQPFSDVCLVAAFGAGEDHDDAVALLRDQRIWDLFKTNIVSKSNDARAITLEGHTRVGGRDATERVFRSYVTSAARAEQYNKIGMPPCHVWLSSDIMERCL